MKRVDYITWDEYFMGIAKLSGMRSKDPNTQVGACIVNQENRIVSVGYNGMPSGCNDDEYPWERDSKENLDNKYPYVVHAELNAILNNRHGSLEGCRIYVSLFPCNECAKAIIQSGIKEVIYIEDKYKDEDNVKASKRMLYSAGVKVRQYAIDNKRLVIDFENNQSIEVGKDDPKVVLVINSSYRVPEACKKLIKDKFNTTNIKTFETDYDLEYPYNMLPTSYMDLIQSLPYGCDEKVRYVFIYSSEGFMNDFRAMSNMYGNTYYIKLEFGNYVIK